MHHRLFSRVGDLLTITLPAITLILAVGIVRISGIEWLYYRIKDSRHGSR